jgi:predicted dehydrogenase
LVLTRGDETMELPFDPQSSYIGEIDDFAAAALDDRPPRVPLSESLRTVSVICALYRSAQ